MCGAYCGKASPTQAHKHAINMSVFLLTFPQIRQERGMNTHAHTQTHKHTPLIVL